ncbi:sodium channel modifier 1 isoform X2 [Anser cygnoides]|uniref:sodium channel modifier 1 isoform X2 n=1 Tax=Anser cygnoides TaxID=8845 RepID=UPI0034D2DECF
MSFKRDGDEPGQLAALQKRRVAELLANYIPEDEALLLRSGRPAALLRQRALAGGRCAGAAARGAGAGGGGGRAGLPSPFAGPDKEDCPERPAEGCSLQQLLPEDGGSWKRRTRGEDPAGAEHCPGSLAGGQGRRGGHPCSPAARAPQQASRCAEGSFHPRRARQKRKSSVVIASESARSPQPCEAPGAGAVPAAAERRLDPGSLWQVGEG